jgi:hypothetical protein
MNQSNGRGIRYFANKFADPWINAPANQSVPFSNVDIAEAYAMTEQPPVQPPSQQQPQQKKGIFDFGIQAAQQGMQQPETQIAQSPDFSNPMQNQQAIQLYQQVMQNIKQKRGF